MVLLHLLFQTRALLLSEEKTMNLLMEVKHLISCVQSVLVFSNRRMFLFLFC